jgi:hypothetical protein
VESGIKISHLDSHQHLHVLPGFSPIIGRLAKKLGIMKIRIPSEPLLFFNTDYISLKRLVGRTILTGCAWQAKYRYQLQGFFSPEHFFGMLSGGQTHQKNLLNKKSFSWVSKYTMPIQSLKKFSAEPNKRKLVIVPLKSRQEFLAEAAGMNLKQINSIDQYSIYRIESPNQDNGVSNSLPFQK